MKYRIIVNMPGCLPETDPYDVDGAQAAIEAIADEVSTTTGGTELPALSRANIMLDLVDGHAAGFQTGEYVHGAYPIGADGEIVDRVRPVPLVRCERPSCTAPSHPDGEPCPACVMDGRA